MYFLLLRGGGGGGDRDDTSKSVIVTLSNLWGQLSPLPAPPPPLNPLGTALPQNNPFSSSKSCPISNWILHFSKPNSPFLQCSALPFQNLLTFQNTILKTKPLHNHLSLQHHFPFNITFPSTSLFPSLATSLNFSHGLYP